MHTTRAGGRPAPKSRARLDARAGATAPGVRDDCASGPGEGWARGPRAMVGRAVSGGLVGWQAELALGGASRRASDATFLPRAAPAPPICPPACLPAGSLGLSPSLASLQVQPHAHSRSRSCSRARARGCSEPHVRPPPPSQVFSRAGTCRAPCRASAPPCVLALLDPGYCVSARSSGDAHPRPAAGRSLARTSPSSLPPLPACGSVSDGRAPRGVNGRDRFHVARLVRARTYCALGPQERRERRSLPSAPASPS
eukprot:scaffold7992_cov269-Prasinococcus_capsulatus_cf.AAC.1